MKIFIFLLILAAFLQSSFVPINLVLILLIAKALARPEKDNLYAAFLAGILIGILQTQNLGFWALVFVLVVELASFSKKLPFFKNFLSALLVSAVILTLVSFLESIYFNEAFEWANLIWEIVLVMPAYLVILFWEDRFVVKCFIVSIVPLLED
jgi:rod shape-determining protein MreD